MQKKKLNSLIGFDTIERHNFFHAACDSFDSIQATRQTCPVSKDTIQWYQKLRTIRNIYTSHHITELEQNGIVFLWSQKKRELRTQIHFDRHTDVPPCLYKTRLFIDSKHLYMSPSHISCICFGTKRNFDLMFKQKRKLWTQSTFWLIHRRSQSIETR